MSKFKVGDRVRVLSQTSGWGSVKVGDVGVVSKVLDGDSYWADFPNFPAWVGKEKCFELEVGLKEVIIEKQITIMKDVQMFVKNLALSKDERALREVGLKTDCGVYTQDAIDIILQDMCKDKECRLIEIAHGVLKEKK